MITSLGDIIAEVRCPGGQSTSAEVYVQLDQFQPKQCEKCMHATP